MTMPLEMKTFLVAVLAVLGLAMFLGSLWLQHREAWHVSAEPVGPGEEFVGSPRSETGSRMPPAATKWAEGVIPR